MKQGVRLFTRPKTFFNQLQWSSNHWLILVSFVLLTVIESTIGKQQALYAGLAHTLQQQWQIEPALALWAVLAGKILILVGAAFAISLALWFLGTLFGRSNSRRVLNRRLAVVFTVLLAGYTLQHLAARYPMMELASLALFAWGSILAMLAIRAQFSLGIIQSALFVVVGAFLVTTAWNESNSILQEVAGRQVSSSHLSKVAPVRHTMRARY